MNKKVFSFLQIELRREYEILLSLVIMGALIALVYLCGIPNPNMILIAGLVVCSATFGYPGGLTAGAVMFLYTLFFFSTDNDFVTFTPQNAQKVLVSLVGIVADMVFVCQLKRNEQRAFLQIRKLTEDLSEDNDKLQEISRIDALTGIRNRYALRTDYDSYIGKSMYVMMLDIDNFKLVNDTCGHEVGDSVLEQTGKALAELFGMAHCYRYGGDEFLVIATGLTQDDFRRKLDELLSRRPVVQTKDGEKAIGYSIGYARGVVTAHEQLREMFTLADERMYTAKNSGKGTVSGE